MVSIRIDNLKLQVPDGMTALEAARSEGIDIPTLCYHKALGPQGVCRLCVVEAEGPGLNRTVLPSCNLTGFEGLKIYTHSPLILSLRKTIVGLLLANTTPSEQLIEIAVKLGVEPARFRSARQDPCLLCGLCVKVCRSSIGAAALSFSGGEQNSRVVAGHIVMNEQACVGCGTCANICPVQALRIEDSAKERTVVLYGAVVNRLELVECEICGLAHTTRKFMDSVLARLDPDQKSGFRNLCPECSRRHFAEALGGLFPPDGDSVS